MAKMTAEQVERAIRGYLATKDHGGAVGLEKYQFNIKIRQRINVHPRAIDFFGQEKVGGVFYAESQIRVEALARNILHKYGWTEDWYQAGRSGGWLVVSTDAPVTDDWNMRRVRARLRDLTDISEYIDDARDQFIRDMESEEWWELNEGLPWNREKSVKHWRPE